MSKASLSGFESIIPTALHTAYPLIFTNIPYAREIFDELSKVGFPENLKNEKLAFELEARYKLIDALLKKQNIPQILEIASGFTPRGLNLCRSDDGVTYVEFDLPQVINKKQEILKNVGQIPKNLHLESGNALDFEDLKKCLKHFDLSKPVAVINQGLMRYLNFDEKATLTENINKIIASGGVWITCDFTPAKFLANQNKNLSKITGGERNYNHSLQAITDRNNAGWRFNTKEDVENFLSKYNLEIRWHEFTEALPDLSSPKAFNLTSKQAKEFCQDAYVGVTKAKDKR